MLLEKTVKEFTGRTFPVQHQDRLIQKFLVGKFLPFQVGEGIIGDKDVPERFDLFDSRKLVDIIVRVIDKNQIHLSVFQKIHAFDGRLVCHLDVRTWKTPVKTLQIRYEKVAADGITCPDPDLTACGGGFQKLVFSSFDQIHGRFHMAQKDLPFRSELDFLCTPDKQDLIQFLFQSLD